MRRALLLLFSPLLSVMLAPGIAAAADPVMMKPGLWEIRQTPELSPDQQAKMEQAQKAMASMPPEQKAMMEKMMAQRGVSMNMSGGTITIKSCVSKEQAERNAPPVTDAKSRCTHDVKRSGNTIHTHFSCADPASEGDSDVTLTPNGFTSKTRITHQRNGKTETVSISGDARWLGSDCGGLQPMDKTGSTP
ncbi:DUF3617 domain-containing protein [Burkholderiaceae bacterium UC74_6]